jgi:hypothetical protein
VTIQKIKAWACGFSPHFSSVFGKRLLLRR